jgi:glycosyltransferase involved in cell wall biosynthesis
MNSEIKVLFVHDGPLFRDGNGDFYGIHINESIKERYLFLGDHVTFLMRLTNLDNLHTEKYSKLSKERFNFIEAPNIKTFKGYLFYRAQVIRVIREAVQSHEIIVSRLPSSLGTLALQIARKLAKPYLVEYVGCTFDAYWNHSWEGKLIAFPRMLQQKLVMRGVPYAIYVTEFFLQRRYPTLGRSIHCSNVEIGEIDEIVLQRRLERIKAMGVGNPLVIGTVAALDVSYKAQKDVIEAIYFLSRMGLRFRYLLVGQGNPTALESLIHKRKVSDLVSIIGQLEYSEVYKFYDSLDIYIHPSRTEGLPRALIEAMSRGCPALGSRVGGIPELLDNDCLFKGGAVREIVAKLKKVNKDWLEEKARINFEKSKNYQGNVLEQRRREFYSAFLRDSFIIE